MNESVQKIKAYYDAHVEGKLHGFVEGNERVECAWMTIEQWAPSCPKRILEIGCGIGDICWRLSRRWPGSEVVGLDVSPKSLEIARKLFGSPQVSFCEGLLVKGHVSGQFDLIVLMDVYEHIEVEGRTSLHEALKSLLSDGCRIVLSFPTPRHLAWLRRNCPDRIQPVDEDIAADAMMALARDTETELLLYKEVGVWHEGDYAHAVLGRQTGWTAVSRTNTSQSGIRERIQRWFVRGTKPIVLPRSERLAMVYERLGPECYRGDNS